MKANITLTAALLAVAAGGCATPTGFAGSCDQPVCHATVTVSNCRISVDPPEIHVRRGNSNSQIHWTLATSGYAFASDGIFLKGNTGGELYDPERANPTLFKLKNRNSRPGTYQYGIKVTGASGACAPLDPPIINDM